MDNTTALDPVKVTIEDRATREQASHPSNESVLSYSYDRCVHQVFEGWAQRNPSAVAAVFRDQQITYADLNTRANRLAHKLRKLGVQADDIVAVYVDRGIGMVVAMLAIMKSGCAYLPLDQQHPAERLQYILDNSGVKIAVTDSPNTSVLTNLPVQVIDINSAEQDADPINEENPPVTNNSENLAYVIYTSGSTGNPKGVMIEHRGLINNIAWQIDAFGFNSSDRFLQRTTIVFDASIWELWTPLSVGGAMIIADHDQVRDPNETLILMREQNVTFAQMVPSFFSAMIGILERYPQTLPLRLIAVGGEALPAQDARRWAALSDVELINCYGPTECTVDATFFRCSEPFDEVMPIGRPVGNTRIYFLDQQGAAVKHGDIGELYIAGDGMARGYINRPDLTAERFVPDRYSKTPGERLYRSGDLGRWMPDGNIEFLGRVDHQVKIRGHRIELGEIESALGAHPDITTCVVSPYQPPAGPACLVAYVTGNAARLDPIDIRQRLRRKLPDYMVPQHVITLDALPLLPNEKVDRKSLPSPEPTLSQVPAEPVDCNPIEAQLLQVWRQHLGQPDIGLDDNFFELGGDSLLALNLLIEIDERFGHTLRLAALFDAPTIRQQAVMLSGESRASGCAVPIKAKGSCAPLFYVPGWGGAIVRLAALAGKLPAETPFYVLDTTVFGREAGEKLVLQEVASKMVTDMRRIQPEGPYHLCGYSLGGKFVYEIAQQLRAANQQVALLALLDTPAPGYPPPRPALGRIAIHLRLLLKKSPREQFTHFYERFMHLFRKSQGLQYELFDGDANIAASRPAQAIQASADASLVAWSEYEPSFYKGDLVQIAARIREEFPGVIDDDLEQGWRPLIGGSIRVRQMDCKHLYMADPEHSEQLARVLSEFLPTEPADRNLRAAEMAEANTASRRPAGDVRMPKG